MPCRDEMSKRISPAFAVTERKVSLALREKSRFMSENERFASAKKHSLIRKPFFMTLLTNTIEYAILSL